MSSGGSEGASVVLPVREDDVSAPDPVVPDVAGRRVVSGGSVGGSVSGSVVVGSVVVVWTLVTLGVFCGARVVCTWVDRARVVVGATCRWHAPSSA